MHDLEEYSNPHHIILLFRLMRAHVKRHATILMAGYAISQWRPSCQFELVPKSFPCKLTNQVSRKTSGQQKSNMNATVC
jgi:hypothetical protein